MRALFAVVATLACGLASAANLYLTEFKERPPVTYQAAWTPANAHQKITFTTSSVQSAAFAYQSVLIRVQCDAICYLNIGGTNPTANLTNIRLVAGQTEYFLVTSGDKLAVIGE